MAYLTRDFFKLMIGKDYFRQRLGIGSYFKDGRSYYVDFSKKAFWNGKISPDGVPLLNIPALKIQIPFPGMVIQYGLGSHDMYCRTGEAKYLKNMQAACLWLQRNINSDSYYKNYSYELNPSANHYSDNSAMTQGTAISLLTRACNFKELPFNNQDTFNLIHSLYSNMVKPLAHQGTTLYKSDNAVFFCETCEKSEKVILNGWIFAIFGLIDYQNYFHDTESMKLLNNTIKTLELEIPSFLLKNGWSYYDNERRLCSPIYQNLHIDLLEAFCALHHSEKLNEILKKLKQGNNLKNKITYTCSKILEKLKDPYIYAST